MLNISKYFLVMGFLCDPMVTYSHESQHAYARLLKENKQLKIKEKEWAKATIQFVDLIQKYEKFVQEDQVIIREQEKLIEVFTFVAGGCAGAIITVAAMYAIKNKKSSE